MKRSSLSMLLSLMLVFASGVVVGSLGYRYYNQEERKKDHRPRTPEEYRQAYMAEMKARLKLSGEQSAKLGKILDETRDRFRELREKQRPDYKAIQDAQTAAINAILSAEQQAEYNKMRQERDAKRKAEKERGR
jgi:hypothetical protein